MEYKYGLFNKFSEKIIEMPNKQRYTGKDILKDKFLISKASNFRIYYAPFDYINTDAKIILVGISPAFIQTQIAFTDMKKGLLEKKPIDEILKKVKLSANFNLKIMHNIAMMLDSIGVNDKLDIGTTESLFGQNFDMVHCTNAIKYPTMVNGKNYSGEPKLARIIISIDLMKNLLKEDIDTVRNDALVVPFGNNVEDALKILINDNHIKEDRCLFGFPHPSSTNARRIQQFNENKEMLREKVENWDIK